MKRIKLALIGAGSTVFMKNLIGDILLRPALVETDVWLMDIDPLRLEESKMVAMKMVATLKVPAKIFATLSRKQALDGADFVITSFQVGGYDPCTISDFEIPSTFGIKQTIGDTLGIGGIMRGLRTVPHLWDICEDMLNLCPNALLLQYVNPMAINCWAMLKKFPSIKTVGLCHSVQNTAFELARDLDLDFDKLRYHVAGINHMAFFLKLEVMEEDGTLTSLYPALKAGYLAKEIPKESHWNLRCPNLVRYEMMMKLGYFVTESSEHFAEYVPYFIKPMREDLIERFRIPIDEYPKRCIEQIANWRTQLSELKQSSSIEVEASNEYAASIIEAVVTNRPAVIYGNVLNHGMISSLPNDCLVELPCLVDGNGVQPTYIGDLPPQLNALIRTNLNVQELTVKALVEENRDYITHAAMLDPLIAASSLDLDQISSLVQSLLKRHKDWLPAWTQ